MCVIKCEIIILSIIADLGPHLINMFFVYKYKSSSCLELSAFAEVPLNIYMYVSKIILLCHWHVFSYPVSLFLSLDKESVFSIAPIYRCGRRGGLMVRVLDSGSTGPGSGPGQGHCVVFLGKTLHSQGASLHPGV